MKESFQPGKSRNARKKNVGASLLAKTSRTPRSSGMNALSLTIFASKLAPTVVGVASLVFFQLRIREELYRLHFGIRGCFQRRGIDPRAQFLGH